MTRDNSPELVAELDRLDEAVKAAPVGDTTAQIALWRQAASLEHWFFIARGAPDRPRPYACFSSSAARTNEAAPTLGLTGPERDPVTLDPSLLKGWIEGAAR